MLVIHEKTDYWHNLNREKGIYNASIVSNLFAIINNREGRRMMEIWWQSMSYPTPWDPSGKDMLWNWPWEQERLTAYFNSAPASFYTVVQEWKYFGWLYHGPFCCVGFHAKHDIIRSVNETLMNQTSNLRLWNNTYEKLSSYLFNQVDVLPLQLKGIGGSPHGQVIFRNNSLAL